ncbi:hypothetical protein RN001_001484 [Aquatica leii]|uniref:Tetratricopeptide repeat protein 37 n=1 Tax=Aquatica leii TaxID=1421715 RepID=A0AAN7QMW9_9COLE|nr:hypothetical protein RN001_001484 [Aquatica leii]
MSSKELKTLLKDAREAINKKDFQLSLAICKKILNEDRENYMAFVFLGVSLQEIGMNDKVAPTFKKAIQISPNNILAWNGLANFYEKLRNEEALIELISIYSSLLNIETDDKKLCEICEKLRSLPISEDNFLNTVEALWKIIQTENISKSTLSIACVSLASILLKVNLYPNNVLDMFEKSLCIIVSDENLATRQYYTEYLKILYRKKSYTDLFKFGEKMFELYSTDLSSIKWMCRVYSELYVEQDGSVYDKKVQIERYCDILSRLDDDSSIGLLTKAVLYYENNKVVDAIEVLKNVTSSKSSLVHAWMVLALCYLKLHLFNYAGEVILKLKKLLDDTVNDNLQKRLNDLLLEILSRCSEDEYLQEGVNLCLEEITNFSCKTSAYVALIRCYINLDKYTEANQYLYKLEALGTDPYLFILLRAQLLHRQKQLNEALELLEKNINESSEWWLEIGTLYWGLQKFEKSLVPFLKGAKLDPYCYLCFLYLGDYYYKFNDLDKARRCYEKVCGINPKCIEAVTALSKIYRAQKNWDANVTILQNLTNGVLNSDNKWAWLQLGLNFLEQEDYSNATDTLRFVVRANPTDSHCWESLADAYMSRGAYTSALKCYQKAIEIVPNSLYALLQIGNIKKALGDFSEACKDYQTILCSNKSYIPALKGLAETFICQARQYKKNQRLGIARDVAENALHQTIFAIQERNDLSCLWKLAGDSCSIVARLPDKYCCMLVPQAFLEGHFVEGNVVLEREQLFILAERCYYKSVFMMQDNSMLWYDLAACYLSHAESTSDNKKSEGIYTKAANIVEHCVSLHPTYWQHWNLMGVIYFNRENRDYALAQHAFIKAVTVDNNSAMAWCNLGTLYFVLGHAKLANEAYSQAQRADPNYVNSWIGQALIAESMGIEDAMDLFRHSTLLGVHQQGAIGYGYWVCRTLLEMAPYTKLYSIHNMHAIPVASDALTWYTDENPDDSCGWNMLGLLRERMGLKSDALVAFKNALRTCSNQNRDQIIINYGRILFKLEKYKQAISMFQDVEEATFNSGSGLALSLFKDEQYEESYEKYEQALHWLTDEEAHQSDLFVALASIVYMFQGPDSAKTLLFQSTSLNPPSPYGFYATLSLGLLHSDRNLAKLVLKELYQLQDISQCRSHYATLICHTYFLEGEHKKAIREVTKLIHRYPDDSSLWLILSMLLIRSYKERPQAIHAAVRCANLAVTLGRTNIEVTKMLCIVSLASFIAGDFDQALISAQKAIHCYPDAAECWVMFIASLKSIKKKDVDSRNNAYLSLLENHTIRNVILSTSLRQWLESVVN